MNRIIKLRAWDKGNIQMIYPLPVTCNTSGDLLNHWDDENLMQFTGLKDKNGKEIYEGDILQFSNKWEWWRSKFGGGMLASEKDYNEVLTDHVKYPYERRVVEIPMDYSWLLSSEIQIYWEVVGNIFQNPELLK